MIYSEISPGGYHIQEGHGFVGFPIQWELANTRIPREEAQEIARQIIGRRVAAEAKREALAFAA